MTKPVVTWLRENKVDFRLLVLSDHKTLMRTRGHDGDPVPFFLYDSTAERPCGLAYTEENGKAGPYLPAGTALMDLLFRQRITPGSKRAMPSPMLHRTF